MWPAGETSKPLPAEFDGLVKPVRSLMFDPQTVAQNRKAWTEEWLNATSQ
jgi:thiamine transport system substrate-binding protein